MLSSFLRGAPRRGARHLLARPQVPQRPYVPATTALLNAIQHWQRNSIWQSAPKGFERFYRKENEANQVPPSGASDGGLDGKESGTTSSNQKQSANKQQPPGGGGGGGGRKDPSTDTIYPMAAVLILFLIYAFFSEDGNQFGRELNWQDFEQLFLRKKLVEKLIVSQNIARVVIKPDLVDEAIVAIAEFEASGNYDPDAQVKAELNKSSIQREKAWTDEHEYFSDGTKSTTQDPYADNASNSVTRRYQNARRLFPLKFFFNIGSPEILERKLEEAQRDMNLPSSEYIPVIYTAENKGSLLSKIVGTVITVMPFFLLYLLLKYNGGGGGGGSGISNIFKVGKSTAKRVNKATVTTTFADVAGCTEAKREIMEFVEFLKDPKKFTDLGAKIPKGALLCGAPGTGKTLLAKATAGEANVPFFTISGSEFVEMFVGVGPSRVRDLFKEARESAPCIVFIDEIDAVGRQRGRGAITGGNDERESTLNQLLVEMDGFDASTNVVVLAGTNRADILDTALTRPGRFDRQITVDKPDIQGRREIFQIYLKKLQLDSGAEQYAGRLAALTPGFVGADIANICNEAAILAARKNKKKVEMVDFEAAADRIIGGLESRKIMSLEEKKVVAYHEAGHAVAGWNLEFTDPLLKVTIVPRSSGALGFAQYLPKELFLRTKDQLLDMVCMALAGRASEQINFGRVTTGAADDLRRVTQIVYQMVQVYGMNERIGQLAFPQEDSGGFYPQERRYSDATAEAIDQEVRAIVDEAYQRTLRLMTEKREQVRIVAELLLAKETITNMDMANVLGVRPYESGKEYDEYLNIGWSHKSEDTKIEHPAADIKKQPTDNASSP